MDRHIKLIVSDLDGTLVDTRKANFLAYRRVLSALGYELKNQVYDACFGLRFDVFMNRLGISDPELLQQIKEEKARIYPEYFEKVRVNHGLVHFISGFLHNGGHTAIASTARRTNISNLLTSKGLTDLFENIVSGEDIERPKPDPQCYLKAMAHFNVQPPQCLIFEDTAIGAKAARDAGAAYIMVKEFYHGN
jgi:HAD superfamily hydrolase (TIGR01509 family)